MFNSTEKSLKTIDSAIVKIDISSIVFSPQYIRFILNAFAAIASKTIESVKIN